MNALSSLLNGFLASVFLALSILHLYWAFGGKWASKTVIPSTKTGKPVFTPGKGATLMVSATLFLFGLLYLILLFPDREFTAWLCLYWMTPAVFLLRAIGDFKYVGLFKHETNTKFSKADSRIFTPLCLVLAICGVIVVMLMS